MSINKPDYPKRKNAPEHPQQELFENLEPDWRDHWWDMPAFEMSDAMPQYQITINFMTLEDIKEFEQVTGVKIMWARKSAWYPRVESGDPVNWAWVDDDR